MTTELIKEARAVLKLVDIYWDAIPYPQSADLIHGLSNDQAICVMADKVGT